MKLAIVGTASSKIDAPYDDKTWDIWSMGSNRVGIPRFNKFFELHMRDSLDLAGVEDSHHDFIRSIGKDAIVLDSVEYPDATEYPKDDVRRKFGTYFTSSIAWMLGMAILRDDLEELSIYGVHMAGDGEYAHQRACAEGYIRYLQGKGVKVFIHPDSELLKGSEYCDTNLWIIRNKMKAAEDQARAAECRSHYEAGKSDMLKMLEREMR